MSNFLSEISVRLVSKKDGSIVAPREWVGEFSWAYNEEAAAILPDGAGDFPSDDFEFNLSTGCRDVGSEEVFIGDICIILDEENYFVDGGDIFEVFWDDEAMSIRAKDIDPSRSCEEFANPITSLGRFLVVGNKYTPEKEKESRIQKARKKKDE